MRDEAARMNRRPVMIFRVCVQCRSDFSIKAISSRALYCPKCRKEIKRV
jgi:PHP family Zn ribbon phosphoesterase